MKKSGRVGERWYPLQVLLEKLSDGVTTAIEYEHWLPSDPPERALYEPSIAKGAFRARMVAYLDVLELGGRVRKELEEADAVVRRWEERWPEASRKLEASLSRKV